MSRTQQQFVKTKSPIEKYINYKGGNGIFYYYDKDLKETVELESLSNFILLDVRVSITGYNQDTKSNIFSNMVKYLYSEELRISTYENKKKVPLSTGIYADIKNEIKGYNGKFTNNIIGLMDLGKGYEIVDLQLTGASNMAWINLVNKYNINDLYSQSITFVKGELSKVGDDKQLIKVTAKEEKELEEKLKKNPRLRQPIWFYPVSFQLTDLTEEQKKIADEQDLILQEYFNVGKKSNDNDIPLPKEETLNNSEEIDDLPWT